MFALLILGLFLLGRNSEVRTSKALWIPVLWMLLCCSRPISEWSQNVSGRTMEENLEGNPLERTIFSALLAVGLIVLVARGQTVVKLLRMNAPILIYFSYCAISTIWSDFPEIAFKRWIKALTDLVMVLIVLTDPERPTAIKRFLARAGFLLVPISILLIKYYPEWGLRYKAQDGKRLVVGVTSNKNILGVVCLLFGLAALWRIVQALRERKYIPAKRPLVVYGVLFACVCWLLSKANSMTSLSCIVLAGAVVVATSFRTFARHRALVAVFACTLVAMASFALFSGAGSGFVKDLGRDPTLTGRTELWGEIVTMNGNPLIGTGFESFWMGKRLEEIWSRHWWHPNEAHNGYLELYLNLGLIGVVLMGFVIAAGFRNALNMLRWDPATAGLSLAYIVVEMIYSFTEAGFRLMSPVLITLMLGAIAVPRSPALEASDAKDVPTKDAETVLGPAPKLSPQRLQEFVRSKSRPRETTSITKAKISRNKLLS